jgi:phage terminase large subunit-like protein
VAVEQSRSIPQAVFHRLHLNRWTRAEELWLPRGAQAACVNEDVRLHDGDVVDVGVDMGRKHDTAAVAIVGPVDEESGQRPVEGMTWGAWPDPSKPAPNAHEAISGDRVSFDLVEDFLRDLARRFVVRTVAFDPWRFDRSAETLMNEGIEMLEFPQSNERMAPASQGLFDAVVETRLAFLDDEVVAGQMEAATAKQVGRDSWRLDKTAAAEPMDFSVALAIALHVSEDEEKTGAFSIRFMDAVEGAGAPAEEMLESLDDVVQAAVYRATPVPWETLDAERAEAVYAALGDAAREFTNRGEDALAEVCRAERARRRAAA